MNTSKCQKNENWVSADVALGSMVEALELAFKEVSSLEDKLLVACKNGDVRAKCKDDEPINLKSLIRELLVELESFRQWAAGQEEVTTSLVNQRNSIRGLDSWAPKGGVRNEDPPEQIIPQYKRKINNLLRSVLILAEMILEKLTGQPFKDAEALLHAVDLLGKDFPIKKQALGNYFKEAYELSV